ncbi:hypothetical protein [Cytophaga aurantiaca]|uniref:hypothetical protein n=1 Tax=Cytophaga aurantiaca TaxID=29530 RepID=UPI0003AB471E|nr:hypothetical protein [Cytophaga aurantiaca]
MANTKKNQVEIDFEKCADIFGDLIYPEENNLDGLMCKIHDAFGSNKSKHHNCLGCNLDRSTHQIFMFLYRKDKHDDLELSATTYLLLMYLVIERLETIFEIIGLPDAYRDKHFHIFKMINKWANFIKHPKAFVLCHHPTFVTENDKKIIELKRQSKIIIDTQFVFKYYSTDNNKKELFKELANKSDVLVLYPDFKQITKDFCDGLIKFVRLIENNEVYREILSDKTTIQDYFTEELENSEK